MPPLLNKLSFLILITFSLHAAAGESECRKNTEVRLSIDKKTEVKKEDFCFSQKIGYFINYSCHVRRSCLALQKRVLPKSLLQNRSQVGNPNFKTCVLVTGSPKIIEYSIDGRWVPISICEFKDGSKIGLDYFVQNLVEFR